jgi:3-hydroxybutyryl-CoA dehydratase
MLSRLAPAAIFPSQSLRGRSKRGSELIMNMRPHDRFSCEITLTPDSVAKYAQASGDSNPVHFDAAFAAQTRYHRLIASGTQTTALLLGLTAAHFSKGASMVGLEYWVRFRRPVFADETIRLEWLIIKVTPNARLGGHIVDLRGRIRSQDGHTAVGAKGRVLVTDKL